MSSDNLRIGDRVRFTYVYEGVVEGIGKSGLVTISDPDIGNSYHCAEGSAQRPTLEILERAKPKWQDGDVARSPLDFGGATGLRFLVKGKWIHPPTGEVQNVHMDATEFADYHSYELIMRDGKPV